MHRYLTLTIIAVLIITLIQVTVQELTDQNDTIIETTTLKLSFKEKMKEYLRTSLSKDKTSKINNTTVNSTISNKISAPPEKLLREYLRCRQSDSINKLSTNYSCPYDFEVFEVFKEKIGICWKATDNDTYAYNTMEYDYPRNHFYDSARYGSDNCTIQRFCLNNGSWATTIPPEIQCETCFGDGRPVKFNSISIMIETISLSLSLISLTIAILCMLNVKRLHLPRNLLHMHLFVAFIFRSIVKLIFIHLIIDGYPRTMITYKRDTCGNIEILSKSSILFHVIGCRMLSSLFWYTDAISHTFIFCEAMFLFTALTSHLFRDRGCLLFVLWGWLSPLIWLIMWIVAHIITDYLENRSTCWLEADKTTYFFYFFYVPYAFYLLINFGIFIFLVRLLYSKYQSNNAQTNRTGNRHLIKSILILIPLFGLHSLLVMWVFRHKNQGHTIWYYIVVIFKAIFDDLQGFFTSLIYFYFNTEIRYEVLRQVQRSLLRNDTVRRSSVGDTLSTRLSVFRISLNHRRRQSSSIQNRNERRRTRMSSNSASIINIKKNSCQKFFAFICPCLFLNKTKSLEQELPQPRLSIEPINQTSPTTQSNLPPNDDDVNGMKQNLLIQTRPIINHVDTDGLTCDTVIIKNEHGDYDDGILSDENDVTYHQTSFNGDQISMISSHTPLLIRNNDNNNDTENVRIRSKSDGQTLKEIASKYSVDNKSLR